MITVTFFGIFKEQLQTDTDHVKWYQGMTTDDLIALLKSRGGVWDTSLSGDKIYKIALNKEIIHQNSMIPNHSTVAFLPPVTGG